MFDVIIIGAGPAGYSAGIYAARREMKTMIIGKEYGGQVSLASEIENYPGFKSIQSYDLISKMHEQTLGLGVDIKNDEVKKIEKIDNDYFEILTNREKYIAKTVIIAMGLSPRRLAISGENEFLGKGVSYCANCDGPFYKHKTVAVIGGGNAALDAAEILSKIATKVYLIHRSKDFKAFEVLIDEVRAKENIEMILDSEVKEIIGNEKVEKILLYNNLLKTEQSIKVDGVFIEIGRIAHTDLLQGLVERDKIGQVVIDDKCKTKTEGIFACGDVTTVPFKQISIAAGQGTIAALASYQYLQLKKGDTKIILDRSKRK